MKKFLLKMVITLICIPIAFSLCFNVHVFASDSEEKGMAFDARDVVTDDAKITEDEILEASKCWVTIDGEPVSQSDLSIHGLDDIHYPGTYRLDIYYGDTYLCSIDLTIEETETVAEVPEKKETEEITDRIRVISRYGEYYIDDRVILDNKEYNVISKNETKLLGKKYTISDGKETYIVYPNCNIYMDASPGWEMILIFLGVIVAGLMYLLLKNNNGKEYGKYRM